MISHCCIMANIEHKIVRVANATIFFLYIHSRRVCYRTTIDECVNSSLNTSEFRLYLNKRNLNNLLRNCPHESESLTVIEGENASSVIFHSPRYQCRKKNGKIYPYRNKELCLYNISLPNCESGSVTILGTTSAPQELQERSGNGQCVDYLQFFYYHGVSGSLRRTNRACGVDLDYNHIPATNFMAVFWADSSKNYAGFKLRATCQAEAIDTFSGSGSA